ncbi:hypothetical protein QTL95_18325 [Rhizobium sp. S152]|uniref:hypothetical protein n=1 Tax=Rhizobium sp. S152 TaxID=3055038 RepID=UPI0025A983FA|nr:hypothetical protein [Rhizobium sp. S152]MDM9627851.1 hypothetical protein [Rhizobium sp. S152]
MSADIPMKKVASSIAGAPSRADVLRARMSPRLFNVERPRWCVSPSDWEGRQRLLEQACDLYLELKAAKIPIAGRRASLSTPVLRVILPVIEHEVGAGRCFGLTQSQRAFRAMVKEKQAQSSAANISSRHSSALH